MGVPPVGPPNRCCEPVHILLGPTAGRVCGSSLIGSKGWRPIQGDSRPASRECSVTAVTPARQPSHVCCGDWRGRRTQTCSPSTTVRSRSTTSSMRRFNSSHNETRMVACRLLVIRLEGIIQRFYESAPYRSDCWSAGGRGASGSSRLNGGSGNRNPSAPIRRLLPPTGSSGDNRSRVLLGTCLPGGVPDAGARSCDAGDDAWGLDRLGLDCSRVAGGAWWGAGG